MKKKILLSVLTLFIFTLFMVNVNADDELPDSALNISNAVEAKSPTTVPKAGTNMLGTVTNIFDFSKIKFTTTTGTENGKSNLRKIIIGSLNASAGKATEETTDEAKLNKALTNWFTAYCLDGTKRYPENGMYSVKMYVQGYALYETYKHYILNENGIPTGVNPNYDAEKAATGRTLMVKSIVKAAAINDPNFAQYYDRSGYNNFENIEFTINDNELTVGEMTFENVEEKVLWNMKYGNALSYSFPVTITKIKISNTDTLANEEISMNYNLTVKPIDVIFDKYIVNDSTNKVGAAEYTKALWIIEHTYPSLSLSDALSLVYADYDTLKGQIAEIYGLTDEKEITVATENAVYGTIQYAIWTVAKTTHDGVIYTGVQNSTELNKLFEYLVQDREIPSDYATGMSFTNKLTVNTPDEGKELYSKTNDIYTYGPFSATYNSLAGTNITATITTEGTDGGKIVDKDGNEITEVEPGQQFFVQLPKNAKLGNVSISLGATITKFVPDGLRGRIYQPIFTLGQNVMSGGSIETSDINTSFDIVINAKTGVEDVAVLLIVTLVAFSLGYLVLSYKTKPVELS